MNADALAAELCLRMGDNALILGQRVSAWCGHAPVLEEDIALANVALDLIGQTKLWLARAADLRGAGEDADALAFRRDVRAFRNCLLVERPNGDFGATLMRQYLYDAFHLPMLQALKASTDDGVASIATKAEKEAAYHLDRSRDLVVRLGDGTQESHDRMQAALDDLWPFAGELTRADETDAALAAAGLAPALDDMAKTYAAETAATFREATLTAPVDAPVRAGGKGGLHSEDLGFLLAEMQFLQRAYPDATW
ncbi:MAG: 1,2-phenylacetyl-CoA epoxidase subunit PaaC [Pseudomonadota bacterium]